MANVRYPSIPKPSADVVALSQSGEAMKETIEILIRQRGDTLNSAVTWQDLIDLGWVIPAQVPK